MVLLILKAHYIFWYGYDILGVVIHNNENTVASAELSEFEGTWVEITEKIKIGEKGTYSISIKKIKNGKELLSFKSDNIMTIRSDNDFIRPKWGIYRSLK